VCLADGAQFVALGLDTVVLATGLRRLAASFTADRHG
jgi:2-keto-3-deoxy-L-rhamnonate aldolase RhmA